MTGFVYAMTAADGRVKIGWSSDPIRRLTKISTDCSSPVQLVGLVPATKKQEAELLGLLAPWRVHRDWFRPEGAVLEFMRLLPRHMSKAKRISGNPLAKWRRERRLSQEDLAALLGVCGMTVSRWEIGGNFPRRKLWPKITEKTGITPADLVNGAPS